MADNSYNIMVSNPVTPFTMARSFKACANGKIYIGQPDTDPKNPANQIQVYIEGEDGSLTNVSQPLVINSAGYPVYQGQIAKFITTQNHSMAVYDAYLTQQFYWANMARVDPDSVFNILNGFITGLGSSSGFSHIGQVPSYAALQQLVPTYEGQTVYLHCHTPRTSGLQPKGGDFFTAVFSAATDDGGCVASVNSSCHWRRNLRGPLSPEMYGATGSGTTDDAPAIQKAMDAAVTLGVNKVVGDGIYMLNSQCEIPSGQISSVFGLDLRMGFTLDLNVVFANGNVWDAIPDKWWDATAAFVPKSVCENLVFNINEFDGGGKATGFSTINKSCSTSKINVGNARNHILVYRNWGPVASQGTMTYLTGNNWQNGYMGFLIGTNDSTNSEAHNIDINWCSNHRFWGVSFQDRTQYSHIKGGTYDFNGKWMSRLTLTNLSSDTGSEFYFGDSISNGTITRYAMSNVMNDQGTAISGTGELSLFIAETSSRIEGTSDFAVGQTISCNGWTATISAIQTCTASNPYVYFDIVVSDRSGDFTKGNISASYTGGLHGHNLHTNFALTNNSTTTVEALNLKGLGIATDYTTMALYVKNILGYVPFCAVRKDGITWNLPHIMAGQQINGSVNQVNAVNGTPIVIAGFGGAASDLTPDVYEIFVASSQPGTEGWAMVTVTTTQCRIAVNNAAALGFALDPNNPLQITAVTSGTDAILTAHITKR